MPAISYILVIWTVVGVGASDRYANVIKYDWRPIAEFQLENGRVGPSLKTAEQMCHDGAKQLGLKSENYRCVRTK